MDILSQKPNELNYAARTSKPIKVGFLSPVSTFKGGAERSLFDLMDNPRIEPVLIVPEDGPIAQKARERGISVFCVRFGNVTEVRRPIAFSKVARAGYDWYRAARALAELSHREGLALIHSNGLKAHVIAGLSLRVGGKPCVFHVRDIALSRIERSLWQFLAKCSSHTILVSRACWPKGGRLPQNVSIIFNSMILGSLPERISSQSMGAATLGVCGRIHPYKGHHIAIEWLAAARSRGLDISLVIRGEAEPEQHAYIQQLVGRIEELKLEAFVRFEGKKEGLAEIYGGLDAVLIPSIVPDPLPRSVMEAMSLGLPVFGYPAGGIPEMINPGQGGWLVASAEDFYTSMKQLLTLDPLARAELRRRGINWVAERFGRERMFGEVVDVYMKVLTH